MSDLHYVFKDDKVYALREGKVVAEAATLADLEKVAFGDPGYGEQRAVDESQGYGHEGVCPTCAATTFEGVCSNRECPESWMGDSEYPRGPHAHDHVDMPPEHGFPDPGDDYPDHGPVQASTVVGPGGLKGKVLGKVRGLWEDSVAVRFENGRIAHLRVAQDGSLQGGFKESIEKVASTPRTASQELGGRLEAHFEPNRQAIAARFKELDAIRHEARVAMASASSAEAVKLDSIMVTAEAERGTLRQALDRIEADEAAQAEFAPYAMQVAPAQESLGRGEGNWLDGVVSGMIAEAESQDFNKIVKEESTLFVSDLTDAAVADVRVTRDMALTNISAKTAGLDPQRRDDITRAYLANVEEARKREASTRKQTVHKEAASREDKFKDLPDDILFY